MVMLNESIELRKSGTFYNCFGDSATIIHYLMDYKIVSSKGGVGFPETAYNKVINTLEDNKISYIVYEDDNVLLENDYKKQNNYKKILNAVRKKLSFDQRVASIEKKIKKLDSKEINHLVSVNIKT